MSDPTRHDHAILHADLGAFLRGVERRGAVFAQLQSGDAIAGDLALAVALRSFHEVAPHAPREQWPMQFWASLLASPRLREEAEQPHWPLALRHLGELDAGSRAVLLLRLVGGLSEADAAAALAIERNQYRQALHHALPHAGDEVDESALQAMVEAIQALNQHLPAERLAHLARLREAALQGRRPELIGPWPLPEAQEQAVASRRWWVWPGIGMAVLLGALALGATFYWPFDATDAEGNPRIRVRPLSQAQAPAARYGEEAALLTHRDFELLTTSDQEPALDDLAFYAWYADHKRSQADDLPVLLPSSEPLPPTHGESDDAP